MRSRTGGPPRDAQLARVAVQPTQATAPPNPAPIQGGGPASGPGQGQTPHGPVLEIVCVCVFRIHRFVQWSYLRKELLWLEVMNELRAFRGLMILIHSDWWLPWSPVVMVTDASE